MIRTKTLAWIPAAPGHYLINAYRVDDGRALFADTVSIIAWQIQEMTGDKETTYFCEAMAIDMGDASNLIGRAILQPNGTVVNVLYNTWPNIDEWKKSMTEEAAKP